MPNNVKDFGAAGDGIADDRQAMQDFMVLGEGSRSVVKLIDTTSTTGDWNVFILRNNCRRVVFKDLVVDGNRTGLTEPDEQSHGVEVESGTEDLVIDRCIVRECFGDGVRLVGTDQADKLVRRVRIARSGNGIQCLSSDDVAVQGNMIVATGACGQGVFIRSESSGMDQISVRDNDVTVKEKGSWSTGIRIASSAPHQIRDVSVTGNSVRGATEGVRFENAHFERTPFCALNRIGADVASPLVGLPNLPEKAVLVGGASSRGGAAADSGAGRVLAERGDPNNRVLGNVGDMFQRLDGAPGTTLYVKEAGNNTNTDWTPK